MQELNLTPAELKFLCVVLLLLLIKIWRKPSYLTIDSVPEQIRDKDTDCLTNPNYGAYIQSQGKYYN